MDDLIRRDAAIKSAFAMHDRCDTFDITDLRDMIVQCLKDLPPVREVKRGRWLDGYCSCCGERTVWDETDYCPNCGAEMSI